MERLAALVARRPWFFLLFAAVIVAGFGAQLPRIVVDPEVKSQLPHDLPALRDLRAIQAVFGGSEVVLVMLEAPDVLAPDALARLRRISDGLASIEGVERVISPFTLPTFSRGAGRLEVAPAVGEGAPDRAALADDPLVMGNVLARDLRAAAAIAVIAGDASEEAALAGIHALVAATGGPGTLSVGGMPEVRRQVSADIRSDMRRFLPLGLGLVFAFLLVCFRQPRGVLLPLAVVVMSVIVALGAIPLLGWKLHLVTVTLPVILLAVANDYAIHLLARFQEANAPGAGLDRAALVRGVVGDLGGPVLAAGLTTIAGLLCLQTHVIVPAAQLGVLAAVGIGFALVASLTFVPAALALLPLPAPTEAASARPIERGLAAVAELVVRRPRAVLVGAGVVVLLGAAGLPRLGVDTNPMAYYADDAPIAQTYARVNAHFGGSTELLVMFDGLREPGTIARMEALEDALRDMPHVGHQLSILPVARAINAAMGEPSAPVADALDLLSLLGEVGGAGDALARLVDLDGDRALLTARIYSLATADVARVVHGVEAQLGDAPGVTMSGFGVVFADLVDALVRGQVATLALSLLAVFLLVSLVFRSAAAGLTALLPLGLAIPLLFGLMGTLGIELNAVTALLSSILVGVGVDYTIHFLWRYRQERREGRPPEHAVQHTLTTAGRGIVFNALSVIVGFSVLFVSQFQPVQFFGFLVVVSIGACLLGALIILPAVILVLRPRFLEPL